MSKETRHMPIGDDGERTSSSDMGLISPFEEQAKDSDVFALANILWKEHQLFALEGEQGQKMGRPPHILGEARKRLEEAKEKLLSKLSDKDQEMAVTHAQFAIGPVEEPETPQIDPHAMVGDSKGRIQEITEGENNMGGQREGFSEPLDEVEMESEQLADAEVSSSPDPRIVDPAMPQAEIIVRAQESRLSREKNITRSEDKEE